MKLSILIWIIVKKNFNSLQHLLSTSSANTQI